MEWIVYAFAALGLIYFAMIIFDFGIELRDRIKDRLQ